MSNIKQIESMLYKEISSIIQQDLTNSSIGFVTVSMVKLSKDLAYVDVFVSFFHSDKEKAFTALNNTKGFIKKELSKRLSLRKIPNIKFIVDDTLTKAYRIEEILKNN